jgi:hypothetical protein
VCVWFCKINLNLIVSDGLFQPFIDQAYLGRPESDTNPLIPNRNLLTLCRVHVKYCHPWWGREVVMVGRRKGSNEVVEVA